MSARSSAELHLEMHERRILRRIVRDAPTPRAVLGARIVLDLGSGLSVAEVARRCDATPAVVRCHRDHFERFGVAMVGKVAPGRGRRPELRARVTAQVLDLVLHHPPPQDAYRWTTRTLAERCAVGKDTVARILRENHLEITGGTDDESEAQRSNHRPLTRSLNKVRSKTGALDASPALASDRLMRSAIRTIDRDGRLNLGFFVKAGFLVPMMFTVHTTKDMLVFTAVEHDEAFYDDDKVRVATRKTTIARRQAIKSAGHADHFDAQVDAVAPVTTMQATKRRDAALAKDKPTIDKTIANLSARKGEQIVYFLCLTGPRLRELRRKANLDSVNSVAVALRFNASRLLIRRVSFDRA